MDTYLFEALPFRSPGRLLAGVAAAFRQEPVAVAAVVAQHDASGGDVEDGDAAAYHEMLGRKVGDDGRAAGGLARRGGDVDGGQVTDYVRHGWTR